MKNALSVFLLLASPLLALAQSVTLPAEVRGNISAFIQVKAETSDQVVKWLALDVGLNVFPTDLLKDTRTAVVTAPAGRYRLACVSAKMGIPSDFAITTVIVGEAPPVPPGPVPPGPEPPGPTPPGPTPPGPSPLTEPGFHVMIVEDKSKLGLLPKAQLEIRTSPVFRDYLEANCVAEASGTKAYRIWDHRTDAKASPKVWQDALARPRASLPWLIVSNAPKGGFEGPLPANVADTIALLKKVKGE